MFHSVYNKLILGYLLFALLGFLVIVTFSSRRTRTYLVNVYADTLYDEASMIADRCSEDYKDHTLNLKTAYPRLEAAAAYHGAEAWIIDRAGSIVADNGKNRAGQTLQEFDPTSRGNRLYTIGTFYDIFQEEVLSVSAPITGDMVTCGYVFLHLPMSVVTREENRFLNVVYLTALILFGLSFIILLFFTVFVYLPLRKVTYGAKRYAEGDFEYNIPVTSQDEIGYLQGTLNYMSDEIAKGEERQRKFIANVSHDFRSPLTTIKGYLEAILDGTIPQELYPKYLNIVISETQRLNKLTEGMLTLNALGPDGYLTKSNFDINHTIRDTAAAFEGACVEKGITFDLTFSDTIQMVYADFGKIQQVLYNLIDNAIKFSREGGVIYITVSERGDKVYVSVKDTGIGIPAKSQQRIWERFYNTDLSRGKDKRGVGLGLAIVREIIQAHGENIDLISTEGVGSEFIFSLPKVKESGV